MYVTGNPFCLLHLECVLGISTSLYEGINVPLNLFNVFVNRAQRYLRFSAISMHKLSYLEMEQWDF